MEDLLRDCLAEIRLSAGPAIQFSLSGGFPELMADENMLRQVLLNLLRNAVEAIDGTGRQGIVEVTGSTLMTRSIHRATRWSVQVSMPAGNTPPSTEAS